MSIKENNTMENTRQATINIVIPTYKDEPSKNGKQTIRCPFNVRQWELNLKNRLLDYMTTAHRIKKDGDTNSYKLAEGLLDNYIQFYLAHMAGVETIPEEIK